MKARHPSARTGGTRSFCQFSASRGPVALRSWGEFGRAAFPSRGHLVWCHYRSRSSLAAVSEQSLPINRWLTWPNRAVTRHSDFADLGGHLVSMGVRQCSHISPCPCCRICAFSCRFQHLTKADSVGTASYCASHCHPPIAICSVSFSHVTYARRFHG
jgi:hypothetical protein